MTIEVYYKGNLAQDIDNMIGTDERHELMRLRAQYQAKARHNKAFLVQRKVKPRVFEYIAIYRKGK